MKGAIIILLLVFVAAAVFTFMVAVDNRYSLPGMDMPQSIEHNQMPQDRIQMLLMRLNQINNEIINLKSQRQAYEQNLQSLESQRKDIVTEITQLLNRVRDQLDESKTEVLQSSDVLVPQQ